MAILETDPRETLPAEPLSALLPGTSARLSGSDGLALQEMALLRALGLTDRSLVRVCKAGDPWIVQVRSTRIGLSDAVASKLLVVREAPADS
jgi:hypothetical protein